MPPDDGQSSRANGSSGSDRVGGTFLPEPLLSRERRLDPYPWYAKMRRTAPVRYDPAREVFDVFRYDDVDTVLSDFERFRRTNNTQSIAEDSVEIEGFNDTMVTARPPKHSRLRGVVAEAFSPEAVAERETAYRRRAGELLEDALGDDDRMEFVGDFAIAFPIVNVAKLLGVPEDDIETIRDWSEKATAFPEAPTPEALRRTREEHRRAIVDMTEFFEALLAERRADPRDDLVTKIANAEPGGEPLTRGQQVSFCNLLLITGNVTTTTLLTVALWTFIEEDVFGEIRDGTISLESALEEVLRYRSPVQTVSRTTTTDVELGGVQIPEGAEVVTFIDSANRDQAVFEHPDEFDPERRPNKHIAFGSGIHYCLGAPLAKLEVEAAFEALFQRAGDARIVTDELTPTYSLLQGLEALPVSIDRS